MSGDKFQMELVDDPERIEDATGPFFLFTSAHDDVEVTVKLTPRQVEGVIKHLQGYLDRL